MSKPAGTIASPDGAWLLDGLNPTAFDFAQRIMRRLNAKKKRGSYPGIPKCSMCGRLGTFEPCQICRAGKTLPSEQL